MSKIKRSLQLSAAIVSIVFGGILAISGIYTAYLLASYGTYGDFPVGLYIAVSVMIVLFAVAMIVVCSLMCPDPNKKENPTNYTGLTITGLVLNALLVFLYILSGDFLIMLLPLVSVGLFIATLCVKDMPQVQTEVKEEVKKQEKSESSNNKIDSIRKLHEDGIINEDEMKSLIIKELEK